MSLEHMGAMGLAVHPSEGGEPFVWATELASRIEMRRDHIERFVASNSGELESFGHVTITPRVGVIEKTRGKRKLGTEERAFKDWKLNRNQAVLFLSLARTPAAKQFRVGLVQLFDAYTSGKLVHAYSAAVERILRPIPQPWEPMHYPKLVAAQAKLYGEEYTEGERHPRCLKRLNGMLIDIYLGSEIYRELKRRVPGEHIRNHQLLSDEARVSYGEFLRIVEVLAGLSSSPEDLRAKLRRHYLGEAYQLPLVSA